jgi:hypothetical protein
MAGFEQLSQQGDNSCATLHLRPGRDMDDVNDRAGWVFNADVGYRLEGERGGIEVPFRVEGDSLGVGADVLEVRPEVADLSNRRMVGGSGQLEQQNV